MSQDYYQLWNLMSLFIKILESGDSLPSIPPISSPSTEEELPTIKFPILQGNPSEFIVMNLSKHCEYSSLIVKIVLNEIFHPQGNYTT